MHEWVETGISAVLLAIILAVVISFVVPNKVKERSARQTEVRKLQRQAQEEAERFGQESTLEYTSMLQSNKNCAICLNLSTRRCSRCKAVRYCSESCQVQHWRQGHKHECREPVRVAAAKATAKVADSTPPPPKVEGLPQEAVVPQEPVVLPKEDPVVPVAAVGEPATESVEAVAPEAGVSPPPAPASEPVPVPDPAPPTAPAPEEVPASAPAPAAAPAPESPPPPPVPTPAAEPTPAPAPSPAPADPPAAVAASTSETKPSEAAVEPEAAAASAAPSDGKLAKPKKILFPYEVFVKFFNWDILRHPPCGLINCGNSCFANVVLQCLTYTRPLTAYLLEGAHGEDCQRNDWCFMCELQNHVRRVKQSQNPFSPIRILSRIRNIGNHLGYGRQEDAHEFMRFAIDSMQSICLDEHGGEKAVDPRTQETTLIHHIFGGHLQSQVKCMQCQHESNRYESMMDLAVEIQGFVESLEDALAQFTAPECLDGDNKYKCDRCNAYVKARKRLTIHEAPNILTVALKRFQSGKFGKLNKRVTFPEVLDISPYMSAKEDASPIAYRLYAAVVHVDMLNASFFGHYICYVQNSQGSWYKIDDSKVKEVDLDKVLAQKAYMLFYTRSSARPPPLTDFESRCVTASPRVQFLDEKSFPLSNGHLVSGCSGPTVRVFPNKVPGVMQAITKTLGNGTVQTVGEGHGSSWIQDVGTIVATDVISPWTGDVEMVSTSADESPDDDRTQQNVQSGQSSMVSMDANNHASKEELISSYRPFVSPEQLLTTNAGKRRLDAGLSPLPPVRGLDTDGFPSWPAGNHSRSSSCPSALVATSDCIMSSSSLTKDVTSVWATESMESDNHTVDVGYNQNGTSAFDSGGSTSPGLATDTFQVELLARAKRQHLESRPVLGLGHLDISRKSQLSNSSTDLGCLDMEVDELGSISEAKFPGPVSECAISDASGFEQLSESSSGTEMEGVEMWGSRLAVDGTSRALSNVTSSSPLCPEGAGKDSKVGHNLPSPDEVSSVAHEVSGHLGGERVTEASGMPGQQETTTVMVEDKLWKPNHGNGDGVVGGNSGAVVAPKRVGIQRKTKLKPLVTPGFLNRPQSSKKLSCPSKRKTGEDDGSRLLAEQCAGPQSVIHDADIDEMHKCGAGSTIVDGNGTGDTAGGCYGDQAGSVLPGPEGKGRSVRGSPNGKRIPSANGAGLEAPVVPAKERKNNVSSNGVSAPGIEVPGVPIKESASHHSGTKALGTRAKQGRNAICACGSQRKWKKCCGKADGMRTTGSRPVGT